MPVKHLSSNSPRQAARFVPHEAGIHYGVLDELTGYAIRRAQLIVTDAFDSSLAGIDMTTQRFSALVLIKENPGLKQSDLARIMGIARSGVLAIVNALIAAELVEQTESDVDRRACSLRVHPSAEKRVQQIIKEVRRHDSEVTRGLDSAEIAQLHDLLSRIRSLR